MSAIAHPDVVFTDLGLALLGAYCAVRLRRGAGAVLTAALASAAFWGALFHACFPLGTATPAGFAAWVPVALSIVAAAAALAWMSLALLAVPPRPRAILAGTYAAACAALVLFVDESFGAIVTFYAPVLLIAIVLAARAALRSRGWRWIAGGLGLSALAALAQHYRVALDPRYFDHNAVYHVMQAAALVLLYVGFRTVEDEKAAMRSV